MANTSFIRNSLWPQWGLAPNRRDTDLTYPLALLPPCIEELLLLWLIASARSTGQPSTTQPFKHSKTDLITLIETMKYLLLAVAQWL